MALLEVGTRCYINRGFNEWQERIVLAHVRQTLYIVCSPDFEVFCEDLDMAYPEIVAIRLQPRGGGLPTGVPQNLVWGFGRLSPAQVQALVEEARELAEQERAAFGVGPGAEVRAAPPAGQEHAQTWRT